MLYRPLLYKTCIHASNLLVVFYKAIMAYVIKLGVQYINFINEFGGNNYFAYFFGKISIKINAAIPHQGFCS